MGRSRTCLFPCRHSLFTLNPASELGLIHQAPNSYRRSPSLHTLHSFQVHCRFAQAVFSGGSPSRWEMLVSSFPPKGELPRSTMFRGCLSIAKGQLPKESPLRSRLLAGLPPEVMIQQQRNGAMSFQRSAFSFSKPESMPSYTVVFHSVV